MAAICPSPKPPLAQLVECRSTRFRAHCVETMQTWAHHVSSRSVPHREIANIAFIWVQKAVRASWHVLQRHLRAEMTGHQLTPHETEATNEPFHQSSIKPPASPADSCSCMRYGPHQGHHTHSTHGPYCFLIQAKCIFTLFSGRTSNLDLLSCEQRAPPSSAKSGRVCDILQTCFTDDNVQCKI